MRLLIILLIVGFSIYARTVILKIRTNEERVIKAKEDWEATADSFSNPLFIHDSEFRVVRCNKAYQALTGLSFKELIGKPYFELFPKIDSPFNMCRRVAVEAAAADEISAINRFFKVRYFQFPVKDKNRKNLYFTHVMEDITEAKRAEEELRLEAQLLDSAIDSIFIHDKEGNFIYTNKADYSTRGYTKDELMGMNLRFFDTPEYANLIPSRMNILLEKGELTFEAAHLRNDKTVMPVEIHARVVELKRCSGTQFDPKVVNAFLRTVERKSI